MSELDKMFLDAMRAEDPDSPQVMIMADHIDEWEWRYKSTHENRGVSASDMKTICQILALLPERCRKVWITLNMPEDT